MTNIYNIYCDESSVDNDDKHRFMVIGAFIIPRNKKKAFTSLFKSLHTQYTFKEIKWTSMSNASLKISKQIIDLFFQTDYVSFTAIIIDKKKMNLDKYHDGNKELAFYKFYYLLLKHKLHSGNKYYISLDKKPVSVQSRVGVLKSFLTGFIKSSREDCVIKHLQEYSSQENILIQIADLFTGAIAAKFNFGDQIQSSSKKLFIHYLEEKLEQKLNKGTSYFESKFNIFIWKPNTL